MLHDWDFYPPRDSASRLARDWETQRLHFRETELWTDWATSEMKEDGTPDQFTYLNEHRASVDFDGVTEVIMDLVPRPIFTGGAFTIAMWMRCAGRGGHDPQFPIQFIIPVLGTDDQLGGIFLGTQFADGFFQVQLSSGLGNVRKDLSYPVFFSGMIGNWRLVTISFDPTQRNQWLTTTWGRLTLCVDGVEVVPTAQGFNYDFQPTTSVNKQVMFASYLGFLNGWQGRIYDFAAWDGYMTPAESLILFNGGDPLHYDLNSPSLGYTKASSLRSWICFGFDPRICPAPATGYGIAYDRSTVGTYQINSSGYANINSTDIVDSWPGS